MTADKRWLESIWPKVARRLPPPPAVVVELGCGPLGGFVPALEKSGYESLGIDPEAPEGAAFRRVSFEQSALPERIDAAIACTSLHHVADPGAVLDTILTKMGPEGVVVVVEWDWERFDEPTARWAFDRLAPPEPEGEHDNWLHRHRAQWLASGRAWDDYLRGWTNEEGLHSAETLLTELNRRLVPQLCDAGPYLYPELATTSEADEQRAIDAGRINAMRIDYVGRPR
jgi:SAM-dependent methyltransferase